MELVFIRILMEGFMKELFNKEKELGMEFTRGAMVISMKENGLKVSSMEMALIPKMEKLEKVFGCREKGPSG